jgi:hypothetical protein
MKKIIAFLFWIILIVACKKEIPEPPTKYDANSSSWVTYAEYHVSFFNNNVSGTGSPIAVSLNGNAASITSAFNYDPGCGASGCANFVVPYGTYTYYYVSSTGASITQTLVTGSAQCITILLE